MPAVVNALATDELRGRYNAISSMTWGLTAIVGPLTAAPLIGHGQAAAWLALVVAGALAASLIALSMRRLLTARQDGRDLTALADGDIASAFADGPVLTDEPVLADGPVSRDDFDAVRGQNSASAQAGMFDPAAAAEPEHAAVGTATTAAPC